jgi:hypothetical protein
MWHMTEMGRFHWASSGPAYDVEVDPEFPGDGLWSSPVYAFDRDGQVQSDFVSRWGAPIIVHVQPEDSPSWVGMFPAGGLGGVSGVHATPSPRHLCVVVDGWAYLVRVDAPDEGAVIAHDAVERIVPMAEPPLLLLISSIDAVTLGRDGVEGRRSTRGS